MDNIADRPQGMRRSELDVLRELVHEHKAKDVLEIGMAFGSSSLALLEAICSQDVGALVSIDPFQNLPLVPIEDHNDFGYGGEGVANVEKAGFADKHTLVNEPSYLALPELVRQGKVFDFIFIDGYHSFDFTLLDFFYSDLLLRDGGILAMHDTQAPAVYKVCQFILHNKAYRLVGPSPEVEQRSIAKRILRRLRYLLNGQQASFTARRTKWCSVTAFRKLRSEQCEQLQVNGI